MTEITNLQRRRIQAEIVKPIHDELVAVLGREAARDLLARAVSRSVQTEARQAAATASGQGRDMTDFASRFEQTYLNRGPEAGLDIEALRSDAGHLDFNVTRCRFVEMYAELGLGDIADVLSCNRDGAFASEFDRNITLDRAQTIAHGAPCCTFRYTYRGESEK